MSDFEYDKCNIISCSVYEDGKCKTNTKNGCGKVKAYQQGREDMVSMVDEKMADILADKCSQYGVACIEVYCDAYNELEDWIAEQLKGEN